MNRTARRVLRALGIAVSALLLLLVVGVVYVVYVFDWNSARTPLGNAASRSANRKIAINGDVHVQLGWPLSRLELAGVTVGNVPGGREPAMLALEDIDATIRVPALFHGALEFEKLVLAQPRLALEKLANGKSNWDFSENPAGGIAKSPLPDTRDEFPAIDELVIRDGRVTFHNHGTGTEISVQAATGAGAAARTATPIHFEGSGVVQGRKFTFKIAGGSVRELRSTRQPYPLNASVVAGPTRAAIDGTIDDPIAMKGFKLGLELSGNNAADLFPLTGIALLPTPPYAVKGRLGYADEVWRFEQFSGRMGGSDLAGDLNWDTRPKRPKLTAKFTSNTLDLADLRGFVGGRPGAHGLPQPEPAEGGGPDRVIPDVPLDISRLQAMDADVDLRGVHVQANALAIEDFHAHFTLVDRALTVEPLRFGSGSGNVAMRLDVDARREPVRIAADVHVSRVPLAKLTAKASAKIGEKDLTRGHLGGTAVLSGTGRSLREMLASANGDIGLGMEGGRVSELIVEIIGLDVAESAGFLMTGDEPVAVRCLIADFGVENGRMAPHALVFDTTDTIVHGEGAVDLRDEKIALELKPKPKDFSPFVLRAPLTIGGTLAHPKFGVAKRGLAARGAAAAVLALIAPPAALAAFIEPGLGKDSQCGALLDEMAAHAAAAEQKRPPVSRPRAATPVRPRGD
ncbi:MAG: AsmA family protein [Gammaproteobacteria bacterium]|nr:AsmA family protein [Gammaproteobacteria bacterium]